MRAVWKGFLGFGLVNIPVALYSASKEEKVSFKMLHNKDNGRIKLKRVCEKCGEEVNWNEVVKGIEIGKDEYYIITKEELQQIKPKSDNLLEIQEFVKIEQIDPIYIAKNYYIAPIKGGERPYYLLKEVLELTNKAAIGKFVMKEKEYICSITSYKNGLLLTILHYKDEIKQINEIPGLDTDKTVQIKDKERELAIQLVNKLSSEKFDIGKYKDTYIDKLMELIEKKIKGEEYIIQEAEIEETDDLITALKASVEK